ncbi:MAG: SPOR domain-containing protein [Salegentibacter sp.]
MKFGIPKKLILSCIAAGFSFFYTHAQEGHVNIQQDEMIPKLLELKTDMASSNSIGDRYKIQLFYGDNGKANEVIKEYRSLYQYPSVIVYEAPNYKVWVGNFRNRLEADRALISIRENFPGAFIPKPRRR